MSKRSHPIVLAFLLPFSCCCGKSPDVTANANGTKIMIRDQNWC